jgi:hypothetical protein
VKAWKKAHPKMVEWQRERWYARRKAREEVKEPCLERVVTQKVVVPVVKKSQETYYGPEEGVDEPYREMRPRGAIEPELMI